MTAGSATPPGWYPRTDRPGHQDYWNGSDDIVSNPFSMPDINLIDLNGKKAEDGFIECDTTGFAGTDVTDKFEVEVTEGGTATYVDPVLIASTKYKYVAVEAEETIYQK